MPLTRKLLVLLSALILIFCAVISLFQYRIRLSQVMQARQAELAEQAREGVSSVNAMLVQTETVLQELALASTVRATLNENNPDRYITRLMFHALESIKFSESILSAAGANIFLLIPDERMPESYDLAIHLSRMANNRLFEAFLSGTETASWGSPQQELSISEHGGLIVPYDLKVTSSPGKWSGVIRCSLRADRLFAPLASLPGGAFVRFSPDETFPFGDPTWIVPATVPSGSWITDRGSMVLSTEISRLNASVLLSCDLAPLQREAFFATLRSLFPTLVLGAMLVLVAWAVVRKMLSRMVQMTRAVSRLRSGQDLRQYLPEPGQDEAGQLASAFLELNDRVEKYYSALAKEEKDKRHAQQMMLQYQMNPHFLFNALYWLQLQSEENGMPADVSESISQLGEVLHYNLEGHFSAGLGEEKQLAAAFISFMEKMKGTEISLSTFLPPDLEQIRVPRFMLQPILENAIHHGLITGRPLHIRMVFQRDTDDMLTIVISNDGREISPEQLREIREKIAHAREWLDQGGKSIGLANVKRRLELMYGDAAGVEVSSGSEKTSFSIRIPMKSQNLTAPQETGEMLNEYSGG